MACRCLTPDLTLCRSGACCVGEPDFSPEIAAAASALATQTLWALTGRRFTLCKPITVRPCLPRTCKPLSVSDLIYWEANRAGDGSQTMGVLSYSPTLVDGQPLNISCGCPKACCTCKADCEVRLPGPVCTLLDVTVDGIPLGPSRYTLYDKVTHSVLAFRNQGSSVIQAVDTVPLPDPFTQIGAGTLTAITSAFDAKPMVELTDIGTSYQITVSADPLDVSTCRQDLFVEIEVPAGGATLSIFQPPNGHWTAEAVAGGGQPTLTKVGTSLTVGPSTRPNEPIRVRIRTEKDYCVSTFIVQQTAGSPIAIYQFQWTDLADPKCGVHYVGPTAPVSELEVQGGTFMQGAAFDVTPTAFVAQDLGFGNFGAINATTPMSFTMPAVHTYQGGINRSPATAPSGTHVFSVGGVPLTWSPVANLAGPVTSNTNSAGYYAVLTPTLGTGVLTTSGPQVGGADTTFQYRVEFFLDRYTGSCCPPCNDYNKALPEVGTWSVTYTHGESWPEGADQIAGLLACEYGRALADEADCQLPANVASLVRQGISIELPNPFELLKLRLTGIRIVDRWITTHNPLGLTQRSRVWSPDLPVTRMETN